MGDILVVPRCYRALLIALAAVFVVASQLASAFHYVLVAHYACAEHGTVHHGKAPEVLGPTALHASRAALSNALATEHGAHDDCAFPARSHDLNAALTASSTTIDAPCATESPSFATLTRAESSIALLSLAPKQSPPGSV